MRIIIFLLLITFIIKPVFTQVPSKKELQGQMLEAINELNKQIAELEKQIAEAKKNKKDDSEIKTLEDQVVILKKQVGMMGGLNKSISGMSAKTFQKVEALEESKDGVPVRDDRRIRMLPDGIFTNAELAVFVKKIHSEVERLLAPEDKTEAQKIYNAAKTEKRSPAYIANIANSLWMVGYNELAIYILGKECSANPKNANNLNNYAAFLTMVGAEHAAIPILQNLNRKYPGSTAILNNLGQAWYGLGDMINANKFLDSTIKIYSRHSQANLTKSEIQKSEGKTQESIESIRRSIQDNYTPEKEVRLVGLGGKLEYDDVPFRGKWKPEPLGIEKFILTIPAYPMEGGMPAAISSVEWLDFKSNLKAVEKDLQAQINILKVKADAYTARMMDNAMILKPYNNTVYRTNTRKMELLYGWAAERLPAIDKKITEAKDSVEKWYNEYGVAVNNHKYNNNIRGIPGDCGVIKSLATVFNSKANTLWQQLNSEFLSSFKQFTNARANLTLYTATDKSLYDLWIADTKKHFIGALLQLNAEMAVGCIPSPMEEQPPGKELPDFDSLTCQYKDEIFIPPFTTIKTECNKMSTEFDVDTEVGFKFKYGWEEDLNRDKITKGTLELGLETGVDENLGPIKGEVKAGVTIGIEVTESGVKEVYIKGAISGEVTGNVPSEENLPGFVEGNKNFMDSKGSSIFNLEMKSSWNAGSKGHESSITTGLSGEGLSSGGIFQNINWTSPQIKSN